MQDYAEEAEKKTGYTIQQSPVDGMELSYRQALTYTYTFFNSMYSSTIITGCVIIT